MKDIIETGPGFWNVRGSFKIGGLVDLGTQASLVRLEDGRFVFLDSYGFSPDVQAALDEITGGREAVAAVINTHPFHTLHSAAMQAAYPAARHFGTARHKRKQPDLTWQDRPSEDPSVWAEFGPDLLFSMPDGLEFIPENERVHTSSILVYHPASRTIHVDDTFGYLPPGRIGRFFGRKGRISVHPMLPRALQSGPDAAEAFRTWGHMIAEWWDGAETLCAAHSGIRRAGELDGGPIPEQIRSAMSRAEPKLKDHERKAG